MNRYSSYLELSRQETEGGDYRITYRQGTTGIVLIAPHGGGIEPGMGLIADAIAGVEHSLVLFRGNKEAWKLRIAYIEREL